MTLAAAISQARHSARVTKCPANLLDMLIGSCNLPQSWGFRARDHVVEVRGNRSRVGAERVAVYIDGHPAAVHRDSSSCVVEARGSLALRIYVRYRRARPSVCFRRVLLS